MKRRDFITRAVAGVTGVAFTGNAFANIIIPAQKNKLGIALVGLGYYSTDLLAPALQMTKNCYLSGVVTGTPSKAETWKKRHSLNDKKHLLLRYLRCHR